MSLNLRKRTRLSYYEPAEPGFDEYLYCERCADFVYDYCAIHGPLLVVPDNKPTQVPVKSNTASCVPRAALTIPHVFLHLAPSIIPGAGLGVFSTLTLPRGVRFGPYCGLRTQHVDSMYCWQARAYGGRESSRGSRRPERLPRRLGREALSLAHPATSFASMTASQKEIYDNNNKRSHVLDAVDSDRSNWMRYVNCARHSKEQNLLAFQYKGQLYYRTIKIIPRFTELMVFYGSEYANALNINLSRYNSANYYKEIIGTSTKSLQENNDDRQEEYVTADQFHFIDENLDEEANDKNSTEISKNSKISTNIDDSSFEETARSVNETTGNTSTIEYECETCQKTFASTRSLKYHVLTHLNTWKFNCEHCLYRSNKHYNFKQHVWKHTNTFKFSCETCPFKTNYDRTFKKHCFRHESSAKVLEDIRSPNKVNFPMAKTCEICDFKTNSRKVFSTHMSKHNGNVYKCDNCSYSNHSKYNLSRHIARFRH